MSHLACEDLTFFLWLVSHQTLNMKGRGWTINLPCMDLGIIVTLKPHRHNNLTCGGSGFSITFSSTVPFLLTALTMWHTANRPNYTLYWTTLIHSGPPLTGITSYGFNWEHCRMELLIWSPCYTAFPGLCTLPLINTPLSDTQSDSTCTLASLKKKKS